MNNYNKDEFESMIQKSLMNIDIKKQIQSWDKTNVKKVTKTTPYKF